ncbi:MAG: hypothetical protein WBA13_06155 [Microcoleaceae cyanobacterium]
MNNNRKIRPQISYQHTLRELSVNRKDPCEVIRELISNSYDAKASTIEIYPLLQYDGFIFFDNGTGISDQQKINDVTPLDAFFSIGLSTKTSGSSIGYKCQGSKLCFASGKFALITRCGSEKEDYWRTIIIDNPRDNLNSEKETIEVVEDQQPWKTLKTLLPQPDNRTVPILDYLDEKYFKSNFKSGTLIFVKNLEVENFSSYYGTDQEHPYIKSYIRFCTRHGDVRILDSERTGFKATDEKNFKLSSSTYNDQCKLSIWNYKNSDRKLELIPTGYPYINKQDSNRTLTPANVKQLNKGRFQERFAKTFEFEEITYCLALAIDGNQRALEYYEDLNRQRGKRSERSGIPLSSQRGTFICSEGIKICPYNEIFDHPILQKYSVLSNNKAQTHYVFMINGSFKLVTNRNSFSEAAIKTLRNEQFLEKIKSFLDKSSNDSQVFKELIDRIANQDKASKNEFKVKQFDQTKSEMLARDYFYISDIDQLKDRRLFSPISGEEHGVGSLYTLLSYFAPLNSPYADLWLRPLNFSVQGIDSIALPINDNIMKEEKLKGLEYKYSFSNYDIFNHSLVITDQIVCWEINKLLQEGDPVDDGEYVGEIIFPEELKEVGCEITNIQNKYGSCHNSNIKVICLKQLIDKTFNCEWKTGFNTLAKSKKRKRSR